MIPRNFSIIPISILLATTINTSFGMQKNKMKRDPDRTLSGENYQQSNSHLSCLPSPILDHLATNFLDWRSITHMQETCRDLYHRAHPPYKTIVLDFYGKRKNFVSITSFFSAVRKKLQIFNCQRFANNKIYLNLSNNRIEDRNLATFLMSNPKKLFSVFEKIIGLNLTENPIYERLPKEIQLFSNLETIDIRNFHLSTLLFVIIH
ncbi:hypothetical protein E3J79_01160 [Candidatus Dependentiae bacterium]|nr:MAG: hypothetical protein E3J79_01160 [Candidatus Dependentiae bacterium]